MTKNSSDREVFSNVITALARDAATEVSGIVLVDGRRAQRAVSVTILPNEKVQVDLAIDVALAGSIPTKVAELQEKVKTQIENATKFKVNAVNVSVEGVNIEQ